jgi:hypothetical protein
MIGGPCLSVSRDSGTDTLSGAAALAVWAGFSAWTEWLAAALFLFF